MAGHERIMGRPDSVSTIFIASGVVCLNVGRAVKVVNYIALIVIFVFG